MGEDQPDGDHISVGDIGEKSVVAIGRGAQATMIVNVIKNPGELSQLTWNFIKTHWRFLLGLLALEAALLVIYFQYKDLHRIPSWVWGLSALAFGVAAWKVPLFTRNRFRDSVLLFVPASLVFFSLVVWQANRVVRPETFPSDRFGIAVAQIDTGTLIKNSAEARQVNHDSFESICQYLGLTLQEADRCSDPDSSIEIRQIGIVENSAIAREYGDRIGASLVIWGQILNSQPAGVTLRFQIVDKLIGARNPDFNYIIPVSNQATDFFSAFQETDVDQLQQVKTLIAEQTRVLSYFMLGSIAYLNQDFSAITDFEHALDFIEQQQSLRISNAGKSLIMYYLGTSKMIIGKMKDGLELLLQAQELNPDEPTIYFQLALIYRALGDEEASRNNFQISLKLLNEWLERNPGDPFAIYNRGIIYMERKEYDLAYDNFQTLLSTEPRLLIAYVYLIRTQGRMDRFEESEAAFNEALAAFDQESLNPGALYFEMAKVYQLEGDTESAKAAYESATRASPHIPFYYFYYAQFLESQQEPDAAIDAYKNAARYAIGNIRGDAYAELGRLYRQLGLADEALEYYRKAVSEQPDNALMRVYLADTYSELGQDDEAAQDYAEAVRLIGETDVEPTLEIFIDLSYARFLFTRENYGLSGVFYRNAMALDLTNENAFRFSVLSYLREGNCSGAVDVVQNAVDEGRGYPETIFDEVVTEIEAQGCEIDLPAFSGQE